MWWKDGGGNFKVPVPGPKKESRRDSHHGFEDELSRMIVDAEVNSGAWTLMHRCNKATDLLNDVNSVRAGVCLALCLLCPMACPCWSRM